MDQTCRISGGDLVELFTLGELYVSDFNQDGSGIKSELKMCLSKDSGLVQLEKAVNPDDMYRKYWYHSGTNESMRNELKDIVANISSKCQIFSNDIWLDIGCNDGTLLSYIDGSIQKIGFDPAKNNCSYAKNYGTIIEDYFNKESYNKITTKRAKIVTSIAMFYDLDDPISFCNDVYDVIDDDGVWVIQLSYLPLMLNQVAFDNICHEHIEYYSLQSISFLLEKTGFKIVDVSLNDTNGGSCRVFCMKKSANISSFSTKPYRDVCNMRIDSLMQYEKTLKLDDEKTYHKFFGKINSLKASMSLLTKNILSEGKTIWGYGASTKGNTLLQYFNLDSSIISGIAERLPSKFGLKTSGSKIPIYSESHVRSINPHYVIVLPWHFIDSFVKREWDMLSRGTKFIVPCPELSIVSVKNGSIVYEKL